MSTSDYYHTLKVSPKATQAEIKQAYRRLAKLFHPDSNQETANHETIARVNEAYEVLGTPRTVGLTIIVGNMVPSLRLPNLRLVERVVNSERLRLRRVIVPSSKPGNRRTNSSSSG